MSPPTFVISLDFELYWGVRDVFRLEQYRDRLLGVRGAVPALLALFSRRRIHATWATVGFLFCATKRELLELSPARLPRYRDPRLSPYDLAGVGDDEASDPFHFAPTLVDAIVRTPGQEVATHTFSHFYCLELGQGAEDFDADLQSANEAARRRRVELRSLVFPRNQYNPEYLPILARHGLRACRSTGPGWPYGAVAGVESRVKRAVRLADSMVPITGDRSFPAPRVGAHGVTDVPASAFLRPYAATFGYVAHLQLERILKGMTNAARQNAVYHLWWHPHNFGLDLRENLTRLEVVLDHFRLLSERYGMVSRTMDEVALAAGDAKTVPRVSGTFDQSSAS